MNQLQKLNKIIDYQEKYCKKCGEQCVFNSTFTTFSDLERYRVTDNYIRIVEGNKCGGIQISKNDT